MSRELDDLAKTLEPRLARAIQKALDGLKDKAKIDQIAKMLEAGQIDAIVALLGFSPTDPLVGELQNHLRDVATKGAASEAARYSGVSFAFDILNPATAEFIRRYELNLIREIDAKTREGIRGAITDGIRAGRNPRAIARDVRQQVGLTLRQQKAVSNFRKELETFHTKRTAGSWNLGGKISRAPGGAQVFAVDVDGNPVDGILSRRLRDFRFDSTLRRSMQEGIPLSKEQIDKMVEAYARKYLRHRGETIARTEALRAAHAGAHMQWEQAVQRGDVDPNTVKRKWLVARDERTCEVCSPIPRMNKDGRALDEAFQTPKGPVMLPPVHPDCRCTVTYRSDD